MFFKTYNIKPDRYNPLENYKMRILKWIFLFLFCINASGQNKIYKFYGEEGQQISREKFYKTRYNGENIPMYFENDTAKFGILFYKENYGKLNDSSFRSLKNYLYDLKKVKIDSADFIVINYLTKVPGEEQKKHRTRTTWNIFDRNYVRKLKRKNNVSHFWISSLENQNLKYFYSNRINWLTDRRGVIPELFFPFEYTYGYYIIIKPNGEYYYFIGEYGKQNVWEKTREFAKYTFTSKTGI